MPTISDVEYRQLVAYQALGTPQEIEKKISALERDNKRQRDEIRRMRSMQLAKG